MNISYDNNRQDKDELLKLSQEKSKENTVKFTNNLKVISEKIVNLWEN